MNTERNNLREEIQADIGSKTITITIDELHKIVTTDSKDMRIDMFVWLANREVA